jgi:hypothetical protein
MMRVVQGFAVSVGLVVVRFGDVEWFGSRTRLRTRRCAGVPPSTSPSSVWTAWSGVLN